MFLFIRYLIQLLLSPSRGWEDISSAAQTCDVIKRNGFYPWLGFVAMSNFLQLIYSPTLTFFECLLGAIAVAGGLFISLYLGRLFLDFTLPEHVDAKLNITKINTFCIYMVALMGIYSVISNAMPANLTFLYFLPLLSVVIIFRATAYLGISHDRIAVFICLASVATIVVPIAVIALLQFIV